MAYFHQSKLSFNLSLEFLHSYDTMLGTLSFIISFADLNESHSRVLNEKDRINV